MRCLTCGKRISPQLRECPNCGAMVPAPEGTPRVASQPGAWSPEGKEFDWKSVLTPHTPPPPFGGAAARKPFTPQQSPPPPAPIGGPAGDTTLGDATEDEEQPAAPAAPPWTQYIFPAIIFLWFAFRIFGPDIKRFFGFAPNEERDVPAETASSLPELRRLVLCERIEQNQPAGARDRFSKSQDKVVTVFSAWAGETGAEHILFHWKSPEGSELVGGQQMVRLPDAPRNFLMIGELPIGEFTDTGKWSLAVVVDGETVASSEFTVEP